VITPHLFVVALVVGAAVLALWLETRFPGLAPKSMQSRFLAALGAGIVLSIPSPPATIVTVLAVDLPLIAFGFLAMLWLLRLLAERRAY
jgi:hypothetical protein